jgi:chromosome segregation ATPase
VIGVQPIGAAYPCGHVFHLECWDGWVASQHCRQAKCAMCNRPSEGFSRLYLDFLGTNDDVSLSSCSDASTTDQREDESSECENDETDNDTNHEDNVQQDVIVIDGGSTENAISVGEEKSSNNQGSAGLPKKDADKYKKVAKQLKQRNKYLAAQIKESNNALEEAKQSYEAECDKRLQFEKEIQLLEEQYKFAHLALSGANLEAAALKRQLTERESTLESTKARLDSLKANMEILQKSYDESLKKARASSMAEVRQMLIEYPKVVQENRELRNRLKAVDSKQINKTSVKESYEKPPVGGMKRKMDLLKELDQKTSFKAATNVSDTRADHREAEIQLCLQKSSCATALSRTLQAKRRRSPLDVLNNKLNNNGDARHGIPPR